MSAATSRSVRPGATADQTSPATADSRRAASRIVSISASSLTSRRRST